MTKAYWLFRYHFTERGNRYSPTFYLAKQFLDLASAWYIALNDNIVPENRYTGEVAPWIITMRRFIDCSYDDVAITDFSSIVSNVSSLNDIVLFATVEEARQWIRDNTDLIEDSATAGTFLINEETTDIDGTVVPATYLVID